MHPVAVKIGSSPIPSQFALLFVALLFGILLLLRHGGRSGTHWKILVDGFVALFVASIIGGRLYVVLQDPIWFGDHFSQIWQLPIGGLHPYGAVLMGMLGLWLVSYWYGQGYFKLMDLFAVVAAPVMALGLIGAFLQGDGFGALTTSRFGFASPHILSVLPLQFPRHPVQLYLAAGLILLYFYYLFDYKRKLFHGQYVALLLICYPLFRELLSPLADSGAQRPLLNLRLGPVDVTFERLTSVALVVTGIILFQYRKSRRLSDF